VAHGAATRAPAARLESVDFARVVAAALSLASTSALMILFGVVYSPAGATTLIISLGIITYPVHLPAIEAASDQWSGRPTPPAAGS